VLEEVCSYLVARAARATAAGVSPDRVILDAGLDLGKTAEQSLTLLRGSAVLARLGHPLLLSARTRLFWASSSTSTFDHRREASLAAAALGVSLGCRIVRVHDVARTRLVCDSLAAVLEAA